MELGVQLFGNVVLKFYVKMNNHSHHEVDDDSTVSVSKKTTNGYHVFCPKSPKYKKRRSQETAYDWLAEKEKNVIDDGTVTFFWRAHTLTVLFLLTCFLVYVALIESAPHDSEYNTKRGIVAIIVVFLLFGVTQTPDGPFRRPHPALWRFVFCVSVVYQLGLIFLLFQTVDDARVFMKHFDATLGSQLPEKDYGGNCLIYDSSVPSDVFHNVWDKMDVFVATHLIGWWLKTLILRDYWLCIVISIMFEILEYSLEHQLPNFSECWWDHWIMDALICNGLGIYLGMRTTRYLNMKVYNWRNIWTIRSFKGKVKRVAQQFTPYTWMNYDWRPFQSFKRWMAMLGVIFVFLLAELNTFYLKFVLWLPPPHYVNVLRLLVLLLAGAVSKRETFQYLDDPDCKKFGRQSWVVLSIIITEFLIIAKFDFKTITKPMPRHVLLFWSIAFLVLCGWTIYNFFAKPILLQPQSIHSISEPSSDVDASNDVSMDKKNCRRKWINSWTSVF